MSRESRYKLMFNLAWDKKGMTLVLNDVPNDMLKCIAEWRNEKVEEENDKAPH